MTDVAQMVRRALEEDIGTGDVTSEACVPAGLRAAGLFIGRQHLVLAGTEVLSLMYDQLDFYKRDGDTVSDGEIIAEVHGPARRLLDARAFSSACFTPPAAAMWLFLIRIASNRPLR